jgi:hypothetical protein
MQRLAAGRLVVGLLAEWLADADERLPAAGAELLRLDPVVLDGLARRVGRQRVPPGRRRGGAGGTHRPAPVWGTVGVWPKRWRRWPSNRASNSAFSWRGQLASPSPEVTSGIREPTRWRRGRRLPILN